MTSERLFLSLCILLTLSICTGQDRGTILHKTTKVIGDSCSDTTECSVEFSECNLSTRTCQCPQTSKMEGKSKCKGPLLGEHCNSSVIQCDDGLLCSQNSTCICNSSLVEHQGNCFKKNFYLNATCEYDEQCSSVAINAICRKKECECPDNLPVYVDHQRLINSYSECVTGVPIGSSCQFSEQCEFMIEYSECHNSTCSCRGLTHYEATIKRCLTKNLSEPNSTQRNDCCSILIWIIGILVVIHTQITS